MAQLSFLADLFRRNQFLCIVIFFCSMAFAGVFYDKINVDNLQLDGNTISSTNTNGDITLSPNGTGVINFGAEGVLTSAAIPSPPAAGDLKFFAKDASGFVEFGVIDTNSLERTLGRDSTVIVRNVTGSTIPKGTAVYVSGQNGIRSQVTPARADSLTTLPAIGVTVTEITNNSFGPVMFAGNLESFDTSAWSAGDVLYLSPTTAGALTSTRPTHPNFAQPIGKVQVSGVGNGSILINTDPHTEGQESGTIKNKFTIGDSATGAKSLAFDNGFEGDLSWTPTAARTLTLPDATDTLVGKATNDILTNKTLTTPIIDVASLTEQASAPATPSSGTKKFYAKTDGKLYTVNSSGAEVEVGSGGGGGGGINHIGNGDFESDATGWVTYADAAAATPVDGTGGAPTVTFLRTDAVGAVLRGDASGQFTKDSANRQGEGFSYDFTIDPKDQGSQLIVKFDYKTGALYASGDMIVYVYDVTNGISLGPLLNGDDGEILYAEKGVYVGAFTPATNSTSYRLIFHVATTNANGYALQFDNVSVGPDSPTPTVSTQTEEIDLTSSGAFTGGTIRVSKVGHVVSINATSNLTFSSATDVSSAVGAIPEWARPENAIWNTYLTAAGALARVRVLTDGQLQLQFRDYAGTLVAQASSDGMTISYPVAESSGNVMSSTEVNRTGAKASLTLAANQTGFGTGTSTITFDTATIDTLSGADLAAGSYTIKRTGYYFLYLNINTASLSANDRLLARILKNGAQLHAAYGGGSVSNMGSQVGGLVYLEKDDVITADTTASSDTSWSVSNTSYLDIFEVFDPTVYGVYDDGSDNGFNPTVPAQLPALFDEFISSRDGLMIGDLGWLVGASGSSANVNNRALTSTETNRSGVLAITHGNASGNLSNIGLGINTHYLGGSTLTLAAAVKIPTLPDATNDFRLMIGLANNTNPASASEGVYFHLHRSVNATNWLCTTEAASTVTETDTGVAFSTDWVNLRLEISSTQVKCYINGTLVGTNTTNIPTAAAIGPTVSIRNEAGTAVRTLDIDWFYLWQNFNSARGKF